MVACVAAKLCHGQQLLLPSYSPQVGMKGLDAPASVPLAVLVNPDSGPGLQRDSAYAAVIKKATGQKRIVLYYLDLRAYPGDGIRLDGGAWRKSTAKDSERWKTPEEITGEGGFYVAFYGAPAGWFCDDLSDRTPDAVLAAVDQLAGIRVGNPGCAMKRPPQFASLITHEAGGFLKSDTKGRDQGAMALKLPSASLEAACKKATGLAWFWASPLDDKWRDGQTAYTSLPDYWPQMQRLAVKYFKPAR